MTTIVKQRGAAGRGRGYRSSMPPCDIYRLSAGRSGSLRHQKQMQRIVWLLGNPYQRCVFTHHVLTRHSYPLQRRYRCVWVKTALRIYPADYLSAFDCTTSAPTDSIKRRHMLPPAGLPGISQDVDPRPLDPPRGQATDNDFYSPSTALCFCIYLFYVHCLSQYLVLPLPCSREKSRLLCLSVHPVG